MNKFLLVLYNQKFFDSNLYGSESIVSQANALWL